MIQSINGVEKVQVFGIEITKDALTERISRMEVRMGSDTMYDFTLVGQNRLESRNVVLLKTKKGCIIAERIGTVQGKGAFMGAVKVNTYSVSKNKHKFRTSKLFLEPCGGFSLQVRLTQDNLTPYKKVLNHNVLVTRIHQNGKMTGVVQPYLISYGHGNEIGLHMECYFGSLDHCISPHDRPHEPAKIKFTLPTILLGFLDVLEGVKRMHEVGVLQGDIKPGNILYKTYKFSLCDFDGSITKEKIQEKIQNDDIYDTLPTATPLYLNFYDIEELNKALKEKNAAKLIQIFEKHDIYCTGKSMFEVIIGKEKKWGVTSNKGTSLKITTSLNDCKQFYENIQTELKKSGCPEKLIDLIILMVEPNYKNRPSAETALQLLNEIIEEYVWKVDEKCL